MTTYVEYAIHSDTQLVFALEGNFNIVPRHSCVRVILVNSNPSLARLCFAMYQLIEPGFGFSIWLGLALAWFGSVLI